MKSKDRTQASQILDHKAEQLAQRHQRRLTEITEAAVAATPRCRRSHWLAPQPALAFATLSIAVLAWWVVPSADNEISPGSAPQMAAIPNWVLDETVPLELLESPEFYRWLAEQPEVAPNHTTAQQG